MKTLIFDLVLFVVLVLTGAFSTGLLKEAPKQKAQPVKAVCPCGCAGTGECDCSDCRE